MKVLQVSKFYPPVHGGIEQVAFDISEGILEKHMQVVDVLCVDPLGPRIDDSNYKYRVFRQKTFFTLFSTPVSISFVNKWREIKNNYDIIHVHLPNPLAVLAMYLFPPKGKIVLHWHSDIVKQKKLFRLFLPLQKWILNRCNYIIVTSPVYGQSSPSLQQYQDKLICIPIGVDTSVMPVDLQLEDFIKRKYRNKKIIFSLGRLVYYKGMDFLIGAAKYLPDNYIILIGGDGALLKVLRKQVCDNNLSHKVIFLGSIDYKHLASYYKCCDVFCLPSIHESEAFGVVQLEAMSFSKPLVSTNIPRSGVAWVNENGKSGVVVEPRSSLALAEGIIKTIANSETFSKGAKDRFDMLFTKKLMVDNVFKLYLSIK
ncbi:glycosyltransferase [Escherichia albertii]|uniref:Putative glycosyltransferase, GT1 family n=1 Tax=Escherichia albertii TaxID=208962 RepID=A0A5A4U7J0_ESCAL|nr:glycosyltransferase [Escherichia albertii]EEX2836892.1 glycosyltransferase [Escherichia albertii]MCE7722634.1 glycosyltransferase [Escherichia albertii]MCE7726886.1 glycosyltransferase [Escherichia albertii]MCZ8779455.1 glycosyltransferase [Escherichia albertii]BBM62580.1 putative glycosyltransferase, GT1 family [Escherichia albertii]